MGFSCLLSILVFPACLLFVPVHVVKRKGRLKPTTTARDSLKKPSGCKNPSTVVKFAASSILYDDAPITRQEVTQLLGDWSGGDEAALEKLIPLVQPELHRLAHYYMSRERAGHTLQTTALLNEAYLQLTDKTQPPWQNRTHFMAVAAQLMRRIMVDRARERHSLNQAWRRRAEKTIDQPSCSTEKSPARHRMKYWEHHREQFQQNRSELGPASQP
jgi:RNA polymerase sigma factor (TIGR02999 family)